MIRRHALLLGVGRFKSPKIPELPVVEHDLKRLEAALIESRYKVDRLSQASEADLHATSLQLRIAEFCNGAHAAGATLLVYFSGHGLHWGGRDWLVAHDTRFDFSHLIEQTLVPVDQSATISDSPAAHILFVVDACREGIRLGTKSIGVVNSWGEATKRQAGRRMAVTIYSCAPGQFSRFADDQEGRPSSFFTRAFAEAMSRSHAATRMGDVIAAVRERVNTLCDAADVQRQSVRLAGEEPEDNVFSQLEIADSDRAPPGIGDDDLWLRAALESPLWTGMPEPQAIRLGPSLRRLLAACAMQRDQVTATLADGWSDPNHPLRLLDRIGFLLNQCRPGTPPGSGERWLLLAAPFVRQAVLDAGVLAFARQLGGDLFERPAASTPEWSELERTRSKLPQITRRAEDLFRRGRQREARDVAAWLMRLSVRSSPRTWIPAADAGPGGTLPPALWEALAPDGGLAAGDGGPWRQRVLDIARMPDAIPTWFEQEGLPELLRGRLTLDPGSPREQVLRGPWLGWLLAVAGRLAIDVMALPEVLVDHIGLSDAVQPPEAVAAAAALQWIEKADGRMASVECDHPAIDMALREALNQANELLAALHARRLPPHKDPDLESFAGWPRLLYADGIRSKTTNGLPRYQTPHVTFRLAHNEVRELLMGEQLYGNPTVAIRELYQNALDACRHRRARVEYLQRRGRAPDPWRGEIRFRQYRDSEGREVLECRDNGVGMGRRELVQAFAAVGKRFADLPEFVDEQSDWAQVEPPVVLYPNSRFGIGVLSYFMLADEIEIRTCRVDREHGQPAARGLHVTVGGSGSLFRIRDDPNPECGGTLLRLVLNRTQYDDRGTMTEISCTAVLDEWLVRSDFFVRAEHGDAFIEWQPGAVRLLQEEETSTRYWRQRWRGREWQAADNDCLWWIDSRLSDKGHLLSDGIVTENELFGCVVDLRGPNRPRLTIDRKRVIEPDTSYLDALRMASVPALVPPPDWLGMGWLWGLAREDKAAATELFARLETCCATLPLGVSLPRPRVDFPVPLSRVGLVADDESIVSAMAALHQEGDNAERLYLLTSDLPDWMVPWRMAMWRDLGFSLEGAIDWERHRLPAIAPAPTPPFRFDQEDAEWLRFGPRRHSNLWPSRLSAEHHLFNAWRHQVTVGEAQRRAERFVTVGLDVTSAPETWRDLRPSVSDMRLWSRDRDSALPLLSGEMSLLEVATRAATLGMSFAETLARLQVLAATGLRLPEVPPGGPNLDLEPFDLELLSLHGNGVAPWHEGEIPAQSLRRQAVKHGLSLREAGDRALTFSAFGIRIESIAEPLLDASPENGILEWLPLGRALLRVDDLLQAAAALQESIGNTAARAREAGFTIPPLEDAWVGFRPDAAALKLLSCDLDGTHPFVLNAPNVIRLAQLDCAARAEGAEQANTMAADLARLASALGWQLPAPNRAALAAIPHSLAPALAICMYPIVGDPAPGVDVSPWRQMLAADLLKRRIGDIVESLGPLKALGVRIAELPTELGELVPMSGEARMFVAQEDEYGDLRFVPHAGRQQVLDLFKHGKMTRAQLASLRSRYSLLGLVVDDIPDDLLAFEQPSEPE